MKLWNSYYRAKSIEDALTALSTSQGSACFIAGGTDLLLEMQQGRHAHVELMVDVTAIPEMCLIETRQEKLFVGGSVPINQVVRSPLVQHHAQALVEASDLIGGPQVRNTATLGGNVAHALPAADGTIALMALGAQAEIASLEGRRIVPLGDLFAGPGKSTLKQGQELLVGFYLPLLVDGQGSAFRRIMRPQGVALPILNMAAWIWRQAGKISAVRIALGPAGPVPHRALRAEVMLTGRTLDETTLTEALAALFETARFRTSPQRATAEYRQHLVGGLFREVIQAAWERSASQVLI
jgi:xanthine dehydrogenase FAD-binding subunit